jgi:HK97 family phage major capsid protein
MGVPFAVDTGLAAPGSATISAVAGDFRAGYGIRVAPLRIATDRRGSLAADQVLTRIALRADGQPLLPSALRALVGP